MLSFETSLWPICHNDNSYSLLQSNLHIFMERLNKMMWINEILYTWDDENIQGGSKFGFD